MKIAVCISFHAGHRKSNGAYGGREAEHWRMLECAAVRINAVERFTTIISSIARDRAGEAVLTERLRGHCGSLIFTGSDADSAHEIGAMRAIKHGLEAANNAGCEWVFFTQEDLLFEIDNPARHWVESAIAREVDFYTRPVGDDIGHRHVATMCFASRTTALDTWVETNWMAPIEAFLTQHFWNNRIRYAREWGFDCFHTHSIPDFFAHLAGLEDRTRPVETFRFTRGLEEAVKLTGILRQLRIQGRRVAIAARTGIHSMFYGLCERVIDCDREEVPAGAVEIPWPWGKDDRDASPLMSRHLQEFFHLHPGEVPYSCQILPTPENLGWAMQYLRSLGASQRLDGRFDVVALYYEDCGAIEGRETGRELMRSLMGGLRPRGLVPLLLDWNNQSAEGVDGIACPDQGHLLWGSTGKCDANMLAALIGCCAGFVGNESGPLQVAWTTATPCVGLWTKPESILHRESCFTTRHLPPCVLGQPQLPVDSRPSGAPTPEQVFEALEGMGCLPDRERRYRECCAHPCDINEHLPTLRRLAEKCERITELGVRDAISTMAFVAARPSSLRCCDLVQSDAARSAAEIAKDSGIAFEFVRGDSRTIEPTPSDLLFVDTFHHGAVLAAELARHAPSTAKWIAIHDTVTFGTHSEHGEAGAGLQPAIDTFLAQNPVWEIAEHHPHSHGLTVLQRRKLGSSPSVL